MSAHEAESWGICCVINQNHPLGCPWILSSCSRSLWCFHGGICKWAPLSPETSSPSVCVLGSTILCGETYQLLIGDTGSENSQGGWIEYESHPWFSTLSPKLTEVRPQSYFIINSFYALSVMGSESLCWN